MEPIVFTTMLYFPLTGHDPASTKTVQRTSMRAMPNRDSNDIAHVPADAVKRFGTLVMCIEGLLEPAIKPPLNVDLVAPINAVWHQSRCAIAMIPAQQGCTHSHVKQTFHAIQYPRLRSARRQCMGSIAANVHAAQQLVGFLGARPSNLGRVCVQWLVEDECLMGRITPCQQVQEKIRTCAILCQAFATSE